MPVTVLTSVLLLGAIFLAAVLSLATNTGFRAKIMQSALTVACCIGIAFYGYGYVTVQGFNVTSLVRALLALCRMFGGVNDFASVQSAPLMHSDAAVSIFWIGHFLAFYVTASAAITTVGERLLRDIRIKLLRRGSLLLIYGTGDQALAYGQRAIQKNHRAVLFVDTGAASAAESTIKSMGAVLERKPNAVKPTVSFLRQIGMKPGKRSMEIAALHTDPPANLAFARAFARTAETAGLHPDQLRLLIAGAGEEAQTLQAGETTFGYGTVFGFDPYVLTARMLVNAAPPCDMISFDDQGRAAENFHAVLVGFGRMGRAVLEQLVMSGQFEGSHFRVDVFDPLPQSGFLLASELHRQYDIRFHSSDGRSEAFYRFLLEHAETLHCIVLCAGDPRMNEEMADDLKACFHGRNRLPHILQASYECVSDNNGRHRELIADDAPDLQQMDAAAMQINAQYWKNSGLSAEDAWKRCDYFSRLSCRASADFMSAYLRAAGKTREEVLNGDWPPNPEITESLARTEHLRWCAFHYVHGYRTMPSELFESRAARFRENPSVGKPGRDREKRLHACLIPWEELDALSAREAALTGVSVDYKAMDRENVLALREVLAAMEGAMPDKKGSHG